GHRAIEIVIVAQIDLAEPPTAPRPDHPVAADHPGKITATIPTIGPHRHRDRDRFRDRAGSRRVERHRAGPRAVARAVGCPFEQPPDQLDKLPLRRPQRSERVEYPARVIAVPPDLLAELSFQHLQPADVQATAFHEYPSQGLALVSNPIREGPEQGVTFG